MTVKSKLLTNAALTIIGIAVVAGLGLYSITKVKGSIEILTGKSTPLHLKMLELQQTVEKVSADFMQLGMTTEPAEAVKLSETIAGRIKRMESLNEEIRQAGSGSAGIDTTVLRDIEKTVVQVVNQRLKDMALFKSETATVNGELQKAESGITAMRKSISQMGGNALGAINTSQQANLQLNSSVKKLLTLQSRLKDIGIILSDLELVKNKFKIGPLKERINNINELTRSIEVDSNDNPVIKDVKSSALDMLGKISHDGGLVALKLEILATPDKIETEQYTAKKREITRQMEESSQKIFTSIDALEIQIAKDRKNVVSSLGFQGAASAVMEAGSAISIDVKELNSSVRLIMLSSTEAELDKISAQTKQLEKGITGNISKVRSLLQKAGQDKMARNMAEVASIVQRAGASIEKISTTKRNVVKSDSAMQKALDSARTISREQAKKGEEQVKTIGESQQQILAGVRNASRQSTFMTWLMLIASVTIAVITMLISLRIITSITKPLAQVNTLTAELSEGDLTQRISVKSGDEIGFVCNSINDFAVKLHGTFSTVAERSTLVSTASKNLAETAGQLTQRAEFQSCEASTLSASAEEMSATLSDVARNTQETADYVKKVKEEATEGNRVVQESVAGIRSIATSISNLSGTIGELDESSSKIGEIVSTITDIADQTNLLALNAAIEAARAGENGRGFAVVADEVRNLATKTTEATTEIEAMIRHLQSGTTKASSMMAKGVKDVDNGVQLAFAAGRSLETIVAEVEKITGMMEHIATATTQQSATVDDMTAAITRVSDSTVEFSGGMKDAMLAVERLDTVAAELQGLVRQFRLA